MSSASKMVSCNACGAEIAKRAKVCPHCGAKNSKPFYKKWWVWVILAIFFIGVVSGGDEDSVASSDQNQNGGSVQTPTASQDDSNNVSTDTKITVFSGDCGIAAIAEMGVDIIGQPTITISITNTSEKDISAIKFYAVLRDVYGEELKGMFVQNTLTTDNTIAAGTSDSRTWQFLENQVKTVDLYVYSVYFSDGTEWGDREATRSVILKNALRIQVEGTSGD